MFEFGFEFEFELDFELEIGVISVETSNAH